MILNTTGVDFFFLTYKTGVILTTVLSKIDKNGNKDKCNFLTDILTCIPEWTKRHERHVHGTSSKFLWPPLICQWLLSSTDRTNFEELHKKFVKFLTRKLSNDKKSKQTNKIPELSSSPTSIFLTCLRPYFQVFQDSDICQLSTHWLSVNKTKRLGARQNSNLPTIITKWQIFSIFQCL